MTLISNKTRSLHVQCKVVQTGVLEVKFLSYVLFLVLADFLSFSHFSFPSGWVAHGLLGLVDGKPSGQVMGTTTRFLTSSLATNFEILKSMST